jgi:hypothetical protein
MADVERLTERLVTRLSRLGAQRQLAELERLKETVESYGADFEHNESGAGLLAMQALLVSRIKAAEPHHRRPKSLNHEQLRIACRAIALALEETGHLHRSSLPL